MQQKYQIRHWFYWFALVFVAAFGLYLHQQSQAGTAKKTGAVPAAVGWPLLAAAVVNRLVVHKGAR